MQFGVTIPLQKFLHWKAPSYGEPENLFFCWDLHMILLHGEHTLMAVNASNAFTAVLWKMEQLDWENLEERAQEAIRLGFAGAGYGLESVDAYFRAAGGAQFTKTHGRRPVAALNRMTDFLRAAPMRLEEDRQFQAALCRFVNGHILKTAGDGKPGSPEAFMTRDMEKNGIICGGEPGRGSGFAGENCKTRESGTVREECGAYRNGPGGAACPCRRKCPRRGHCEECLAFHRDQKPGVLPACRKKR